MKTSHVICQIFCNKGLYTLIERVIDTAIPLWNMTLGPLKFNDWSSYLRVDYYGNRFDLIAQHEPDVFKNQTPN